MELVDLDAPAKVVKKHRAHPVAVSKTLQWLRGAGYACGCVERYDVYANKKHDLFGFIDYIAICDTETLGVQICGADFSSHIKKLTVERCDSVIRWLRCPTRTVVLIGWRKLKVGKKAVEYKPRVMDFWLEGDELRWEER